MRAFAFLVFLFVLLPVAELALLLRVGGAIGFVPTLGLVLLTGAAGAVLARREGFRTVAVIRSELARGRLPAGPLLEGACVLVGGALLLTPGFLTDAVGVVLLLPPSRRGIGRWVRGRLDQGMARGTIQVVVGGSARGFRAWGGGWPSSAPPGSEGPGERDGREPVVRAEVLETRPGPPLGGEASPMPKGGSISHGNSRSGPLA